MLLLAATITAHGGGDQEGDPIETFQYNSALQASQDAIGRETSDYLLTDHEGRSVRFADFKGKPLVLSLVYSSCYQICPMTTRHLAKMVEKAREAVGEEKFEVAIIGFDAQNDTPQAMAHFAKNQGINDANWSILSASPKTIKQISKDLGFQFFASPSGFDHVIQASILDAEGRVYRQVYGEVFETPLLVEPLLELIFDRPQPNQPFIDGLFDRIRFFCTTYDPSRDGYHFDYSLFIGLIIGIFIIIATTVFIFREAIKGRRDRSR